MKFAQQEGITKAVKGRALDQDEKTVPVSSEATTIRISVERETKHAGFLAPITVDETHLKSLIIIIYETYEAELFWCE
jgi:hypothetical protein